MMILLDLLVVGNVKVILNKSLGSRKVLYIRASSISLLQEFQASRNSYKPWNMGNWGYL